MAKDIKDRMKNGSGKDVKSVTVDKEGNIHTVTEGKTPDGNRYTTEVIDGKDGKQTTVYEYYGKDGKKVDHRVVFVKEPGKNRSFKEGTFYYYDKNGKKMQEVKVHDFRSYDSLMKDRNKIPAGAIVTKDKINPQQIIDGLNRQR